MGSIVADEEYWTCKGRVDSFSTISARRASNARGKATKATRWPHKFLAPQKLAEAGFYFNPSPKENDNVTCFLCQKSIVGWEHGDSPFEEHLKLSPNCGFAIVASITADNAQLRAEYPASDRMVEARIATFGNRWPHEQKRGWKCKTKELVNAGWIFMPTPESEDHTMCPHCELCLDGWEPVDDPNDQHFRRSPECPFFTLMTEHPEKSTKTNKAPKARKPRGSKASRLSTQSNLTEAPEAPSFIDLQLEGDESVLIEAADTTMQSQSGRTIPKTTKKKAPGRKTKAKTEDPIEVLAAPEPEDDDFEVKIPVKPKSTRGKKRKSETMEDSVMTVTDVPAPKRRQTRSRTSTAVDDSVFGNSVLLDVSNGADHSILDTTAAPKKQGRASKGGRKKSALVKPEIALHVPNDDELDAALEADLDRDLSADEASLMDVDKPLNNRRASRSHKTSNVQTHRPARSSTVAKPDHAMFDTSAANIDEQAIEAELHAMELEESKPLPKAKNAKAKAVRKPSAKQAAAAKKAAEADLKAKAFVTADEGPRYPESMPAPSPTPDATTGHKKPTGRVTRSSLLLDQRNSLSDMSAIDITNLENHDSGNDTDVSMASQPTVVRGGPKGRVSKLTTKANGGKKAPTRNIEDIVNSIVSEPDTTWPPPDHSVNLPSKKAASKIKASIHMDDSATSQPLTRPEEPIVSVSFVDASMKPPKAKAVKAKAKGKGKVQAIPPPEESLEAPQEPQAPKPRAPTPPPKEATPSPSPQSSDAENQPPSSKPSTAKSPHAVQRIPLATSTPAGNISPSKRNVIAGLQNTIQQWTAVDLDDIFLRSPSTNKENASLDAALEDLGKAVEKAKRGELSNTEKKMTVEQWIQYNAQVAEEKLKGECERMVNIFEREGGRAMRILEGVECEQ